MKFGSLLAKNDSGNKIFLLFISGFFLMFSFTLYRSSFGDLRLLINESSQVEGEIISIKKTNFGLGDELSSTPVKKILFRYTFNDVNYNNFSFTTSSTMKTGYRNLQ